MEIEIDGVIDTGDSEITVDEFLDEFIEWVNSKGYKFGGKVELIQEYD